MYKGKFGCHSGMEAVEAVELSSLIYNDMTMFIESGLGTNDVLFWQ